MPFAHKVVAELVEVPLGRMTGYSECAGINRHVVGDERALQERRQRLHPGLESCRRDREVSLEA